MNTFKQLTITILIIGFLSSCNAQPSQIQQCDSIYKNAKTLFGNYGRSSDKIFLQKALSSLDTSMKCEETRIKSISLKISLYFLLQDYKTGAAFVDSLQITDFNRSFKK